MNNLMTRLTLDVLAGTMQISDLLKSLQQLFHFSNFLISITCMRQRVNNYRCTVNTIGGYSNQFWIKCCYEEIWANLRRLSEDQVDSVWFSRPHGTVCYSPLIFPGSFTDEKRHVTGLHQCEVGSQLLLKGR